MLSPNKSAVIDSSIKKIDFVNKKSKKFLRSSMGLDPEVKKKRMKRFE
jgi:hypothetical protein